MGNNYKKINLGVFSESSEFDFYTKIFDNLKKNYDVNFRLMSSFNELKKSFIKDISVYVLGEVHPLKSNISAYERTLSDILNNTNASVLIHSSEVGVFIPYFNDHRVGFVYKKDEPMRISDLVRVFLSDQIR